MSSVSVAQLPSVESPSHALSSLREHFGADSVYSLTVPYRIADLSLDDSASNLVIVQLPETGTDYRQSLSAIGEYWQWWQKIYWYHYIDSELYDHCYIQLTWLQHNEMCQIPTGCGRIASFYWDQYCTSADGHKCSICPVKTSNMASSSRNVAHSTFIAHVPHYLVSIMTIIIIQIRKILTETVEIRKIVTKTAELFLDGWLYWIKLNLIN